MISPPNRYGWFIVTVTTSDEIGLSRSNSPLSTLSMKMTGALPLSQEGLAKLMIYIACCCYYCSPHTCTVHLLVYNYSAHSNYAMFRKLLDLLLFMNSFNPWSPVTSPDIPLILWAVPCESLVVYWRASALPRCTVRAFSCCLFEGSVSCIMDIYPEKDLGTSKQDLCPIVP